MATADINELLGEIPIGDIAARLGVDEATARPAAVAVLQEFDRLHRTYHAWRPSELSQLNAAIKWLPGVHDWLRRAVD